MHGDAFDVAIVGAGIAGASLAAALAPQARVLLLEREDLPGRHSTGRSAAMFMESYGSPQGRALTRASRATYQALGVLAPRGALYAAWHGQGPALQALHDELAHTGVAVQRQAAADALVLVPVLRPAGLLGALWEPGAMDIDVHALHQAFLRQARHAGAPLWCEAELLQARRSGARWHLALAGGREARAAVLVNAAGAWADAVAQACGVAPQGVQPCRRSAFTFAPPAGADVRAWPSVVAADEGWYFKPDAGLLVGSPANADPVPAHDVVAEELDIATAIARIQRDTTLEIRRPQRTWAGLRSFVPDGEMLIGPDRAEPAFFWLAGQGGWGIQSAAAAGELAAALLLRRPLPAALADAGVQPERVRPGR